MFYDSFHYVLQQYLSRSDGIIMQVYVQTADISMETLVLNIRVIRGCEVQYSTRIIIPIIKINRIGYATVNVRKQKA